MLVELPRFFSTVENLKKLSGNSQVGIEIVLEYEDGSTESRFIDLY